MREAGPNPSRGGAQLEDASGGIEADRGSQFAEQWGGEAARGTESNPSRRNVVGCDGTRSEGASGGTGADRKGGETAISGAGAGGGPSTEQATWRTLMTQARGHIAQNTCASQSAGRRMQKPEVPS